MSRYRYCPFRIGLGCQWHLRSRSRFLTRDITSLHIVIFAWTLVVLLCLCGCPSSSLSFGIVTKRQVTVTCASANRLSIPAAGTGSRFTASSSSSGSSSSLRRYGGFRHSLVLTNVGAVAAADSFDSDGLFLSQNITLSNSHSDSDSDSERYEASLYSRQHLFPGYHDSVLDSLDVIDSFVGDLSAVQQRALQPTSPTEFRIVNASIGIDTPSKSEGVTGDSDREVVEAIDKFRFTISRADLDAALERREPAMAKQQLNWGGYDDMSDDANDDDYYGSSAQKEDVTFNYQLLEKIQQAEVKIDERGRKVVRIELEENEMSHVISSGLQAINSKRVEKGTPTGASTEPTPQERVIGRPILSVSQLASLESKFDAMVRSKPPTAVPILDLLKREFPYLRFDDPPLGRAYDVNKVVVGPEGDPTDHSYLPSARFSLDNYVQSRQHQLSRRFRSPIAWLVELMGGKGLRQSRWWISDSGPGPVLAYALNVVTSISLMTLALQILQSIERICFITFKQALTHMPFLNNLSSAAVNWLSLSVLGPHLQRFGCSFKLSVPLRRKIPCISFVSIFAYIWNVRRLEANAKRKY